jgi:nucleoside-diphosphate-sugar epimerase
MSEVVILGAKGNIGMAASSELRSMGYSLTHVSRNPVQSDPKDRVLSADLLNRASVLKAVEGAHTVLLTAGLAYSSAVWEAQWPVVMRNTLDACIATGARLAFFDNIYALDPRSMSRLTEETAMKPRSRKGMVRKQILEMLWSEVEAGKLKALVARAPDFYGPGASNSLVNELIVKRMKLGKSPQWIYDGKAKHSFIYVPDAGKAMALLSTREEAYNQVWNLPTDRSFPSAEAVVDMLNEIGQTHAKLQVLPGFMVGMLGIFIPPMRELPELKEQLAGDYGFDSSKIERVYGLKPTPMMDGLRMSWMHG